LGTSIMIDSFRKSVEYWIQQTVQADIYIAPVANLMVKSNDRIPLPVLQRIKSVKGVMDVDTHHEMWMESPFPDRTGSSRKIKVSSFRFDILEKHRRFIFKGKTPQDLSRQKNGILINESFANHFQKKEGDIIPLNTPSGRTDFQVVGVFYDYSTDSGQLVINQPEYASLWKDDGIYSIALYLEPSFDSQSIKQEIENDFTKQNHLAVFSNRDLRHEILRIFDQTFAITLGLRLIAVVVATTGMFFTLTALISERSREWAILRSLGVTAQGVFGIACMESLVIAMIGWIGSCIAGIGIAWLLAFVINKAYFGWTVQWFVNPQIFIWSLGLAFFSAFAACSLAVWKQLKVPLAEALRYE
jgi:putative ABC transport system permease protein